MGVGRDLLKRAVITMRNWPECMGVFLHVIEHNEKAINFYRNLEFRSGGRVKDYYLINNKRFDSYIYYKLFAERLYEIKQKNCRDKIKQFCKKLINI